MKMPSYDEEEAQFAMAPMIDMVFLLLVFFMCASHLSTQQNIKLDMATASKGVIPEERPDRWVVNITEDGTVYSGATPIKISVLQNMITTEFKENPNLKVYLRADAKTKHEKVKNVMNAMAEAGINDLVFGVYNPPESRRGDL